MILAAHELTVRLGGADVLHGIAAALEPGTITAVCGPNGAGKSTLLACLAGLIEPQAGAVALGETPLLSLHPRDRAKAIGYLPQTGEIAWDVAMGSLVALGRLPHRDRGEQAVAAAIEACGLAELAHRPVSTLSGGERARALWRAFWRANRNGSSPTSRSPRSISLTSLRCSPGCARLRRRGWASCWWSTTWPWR
jgi:iron complex transport system ATP-binding protein